MTGCHKRALHSYSYRGKSRGHNLKGEKTDGQSDIPLVVDVEYPESEPRLTKDGTKRKGYSFPIVVE